METSDDKRSDERVAVMLPVHLDQVTGVTRDISASGICFDIDANYTPGSEINFVIEVETFSEKMLLKCKGQVVRVMQQEGRVSIAVSIAESVMESA